MQQEIAGTSRLLICCSSSDPRFVCYKLLFHCVSLRHLLQVRTAALRDRQSDSAAPLLLMCDKARIDLGLKLAKSAHHKSSVQFTLVFSGKAPINMELRDAKDGTFTIRIKDV